MQKFEITGSAKDKQESGRPTAVKDDITVAKVLHSQN